MSVYVQLEVEARYSLSSLTNGWTDKEIDALLAGDEDAKDAVIEEAEMRALIGADDANLLHVEVNLFDFRKKSA